MDTPIFGGCLCEGVRFEVEPPFQIMAHCHCSRCRKGTGTGHATNLVLGVDQLRWTQGEALITRFDLESARSFGKWFCSRCGSPLPRVTRDGQRVVLPAGSLDEAPPIEPQRHIFYASKAPWGCEAQGLPTHDEYPETW